MPIRGETVGTAYVRILADGSELGDGIAEQMRDHEDAFKAAGDRDSRAYAKAFEQGVKDNPSFIKLAEALNKGIASGDLSRDFFNSETWHNFQDTLETRFGVAGKVASEKLAEEFRRNATGPGGLIDELKNITPRIADATEQIVKAEQKIADDFERDFHREMEVIDRDTRRTMGNLNRELENHAGILARLRTLSVSLFGDATRQAEKMTKAIEAQGKELDKNHSFLRTSIKDFDKLSDTIARGFGKGARNNFVNAIGVIIGAILDLGINVGKVAVKVVDGLVSMIESGANFARQFTQQMNQGATAAEAFATTVGAGLGEGLFATVATGGLNIAIGLGVLIGAMTLAAATAGVLVSALLLLGGAIIALAGTVEGALIAAFAALAPLIIPLAAIIGGVVATIFEFKNATGALKKSMDQVKKSSKDLFKNFKDAAFKNAPELTKRISEEMKNLSGFATAAGKGFNRFATALVDSITGPEFKAFTDTFTKFLPSAMASLGKIFGNVFTGLAGILRAAAPLAQQLLDSLVGATQNFSDFTNSAKGQDAIKDFLSKAADSAKSLGDFLGQAFSLIQDLLSAGQGTGDSLFTSMANALQRVRDYLNENPDALKNFFSDAKRFAEELGHAIEDVVSAIDKIDTPETRNAASAFVHIFGEAVKGVAKFIAILQDLVGIAAEVVGLVIGQFVALSKGAIESLGLIAHAAGILGGAIPGPVGKGLKAAAGAFETFAGEADDKLDAVARSVGVLETQVNKFNPSMNIDTSAANHALDVLSSHAAYVAAQIAHNAAAAAAAASGNQNTNTTHSGGPQNPDTRTPSGNQRTSSGITINVQTPTTDPRAVAAETVNRLVVLGY